MFDTLAFGVGFGELLGSTLDVRPHVLELRGDLLLEGELLNVDGMVGVRGHGGVGVLLPSVGLRPADDDLDTVVLDGAGEGLAQAAFGDEGLYGFLHLRTECFECRFGFVTCYLRSEKLVDNFVV